MGTHTIPRMSVEERAALVRGLLRIHPRSAQDLQDVLLCDRMAVIDAINLLRKTPGVARVVDWKRPPRGRGRWVPIYGMGMEDVPEPSMDKNVKNAFYREADALIKLHGLYKQHRSNIYNLLVAFHYTPEMTRAQMREALHYENERSGDKTIRLLREKRVIHVCGHDALYAIDGRGRWLERFALGDTDDVPEPEIKPKERRYRPRLFDDPMLAWVKGNRNESKAD